MFLPAALENLTNLFDFCFFLSSQTFLAQSSSLCSSNFITTYFRLKKIFANTLVTSRQSLTYKSYSVDLLGHYFQYVVVVESQTLGTHFFNLVRSFKLDKSTSLLRGASCELVKLGKQQADM
jgi:hypothetical protein